ncbi:MAG TPA: hypothetical protein VF064_08190 [Pyrinomonadaceae bacterium]
MPISLRAIRHYVAALALCLAAVVVFTREIGPAEWVALLNPFLFLLLDIREERCRLKALEDGLNALDETGA